MAWEGMAVLGWRTDAGSSASTDELSRELPPEPQQWGGTEESKMGIFCCPVASQREHQQKPVLPRMRNLEQK